MKVFFKSIIRFFEDDGPRLAASIAYFTLLSFVPFCLLLITIFGYFLGHSQAFHDFFAARLIMLFPTATSQIIKELTSLLTYKRIGFFTFIIYFFFSYQLYLTLEKAVHAIFREKASSPLLISLVKSLLIVSMIAFFTVVSFAATSAIRMLKPRGGGYIGWEIGLVLGLLIKYIIPVLLSLFIATTFYVMLPRKRVKIMHALQGGLFTTIFLELARHLFTIYVVSAAPQLGAIYASLASFVIFLIWVFYGACIFLVGAEVVNLLETSGGSRV